MSDVLPAAARAWAGRVVGSAVTAIRAMPGGMTSTILALAHDDGQSSVLRLVDRPPWRDVGDELVIREHEVMAELASTPVPAPVGLGIDPAGRHCGVAGHLMTLVPGAACTDVSDLVAIDALASTLVQIHRVRPSIAVRDFQTWATPDKFTVPPWTPRPGAWRAAFDLLRGPPPVFAPTFLHRDYRPANVLWDGDRLTGVVDWVETSIGPAGLDVAHCASGLAMHNGSAAAAAFVDRYVTVSGIAPSELDPHWFAMDVVGHLQKPGRAPLVSDVEQLGRLEEWLAERLR